jgi:hypothetical protein
MPASPSAELSAERRAAAGIAGMVATVGLTGAWLGAVIFFGAAVTPALFAVLTTRSLAGAIVARTLPPLFFSGMVIGLLGAVLALGGMRPLRRTRLSAGALMMIACVYGQVVVGARLERVRENIGPVLDAVPVTDPRRVAFGHLHALSVGALGVAALCAAMLLLAAAIHVRSQSEATHG